MDNKESEIPASGRSGVTCRLLEINDVVYYKIYHGVLNGNYTWGETKVIRISKTLAYLNNGRIAYRKPRKHPRDEGYHWPVKNSEGVYPNCR